MDTPPDIELPGPVPVGFDSLYGLVVTEIEGELVRGEVKVAPEHLQPFGLVHGGVYAAMAESLASLGTYFAVRGEHRAVMGISNQTNFVRPIGEGTIHGVARARHRGRTTWVWDVECLDDAQRSCVLTRVTIAVR